MTLEDIQEGEVDIDGDPLWARDQQTWYPPKARNSAQYVGRLEWSFSNLTCFRI